MSGSAVNRPRRALVVFANDTRVPWLRSLKRGYRHCFVVLEAGPRVPSDWIVYDPLSHYTEISAVSGMGRAAITAHYRGLGFQVVETGMTRPSQRAALWRPYTCVEAVKRVLGIQAPGVFTPWQLHEFLKNRIKGK